MLEDYWWVHCLPFPVIFPCLLLSFGFCIRFWSKSPITPGVPSPLVPDVLLTSRQLVAIMLTCSLDGLDLPLQLGALVQGLESLVQSPITPTQNLIIKKLFIRCRVLFWSTVEKLRNIYSVIGEIAKNSCNIFFHKSSLTIFCQVLEFSGNIVARFRSFLQLCLSISSR